VENGKIEVKHVSGDKSGFEFIGRYKYKNRYHQRSISYGIKNNFIEIKDSVSHGKGILNFMLAPGSKPKITETGFLLEKISFEFSRVSNIIIKDNKYSSGYGKIEPNKCVRVFLAANDISYYIKFNK